MPGDGVAEPAHDDEDIVARLSRYLPTLQALASAAPEPGRVTATDATGTIRVGIAPDGLPETIEIGPEWRRTIGAHGLGAAVTEACQNGQTRQSEQFAQTMTDSGWVRRFTEVLDFLTGAGPPPPDLVTGPPPAAPAAMLQESTWVMEQLAEISDSYVADPDGPDLGEYTATSAYGQLTVTRTSSGVVRCDVDVDWAARQSDVEDLANAFVTAFASLRATFAAAEAARASADARLAGLLDVPTDH